MMMTLMCSKNPWTLGIMENGHMINMEKLREHVESCKECQQYYTESIFKLIDRISQEENQALLPSSKQVLAKHQV
jgi:hypothetical protein